MGELSRTKRRAFVAVLVASMLLLVNGCGKSSSETAPNTPEQLNADKAVAKQAVLKPSDLPSAYKVTPHKRDPANDTPKAILRKFATCAKVPQSQAAELINGADDPGTASVDSPDFSFVDTDSGTSIDFQNTVAFDRSSKEISEPIDVIGAEDALPCWKDLFKAAFQTGATAPLELSEIAVTPIDVGDVGDQSFAFECRVVMTKGTRSARAFHALYFVRSGRAGITLSASGIGKPVDQSLSLYLVKTIADRLENTT
jgi:hypothetical protein